MINKSKLYSIALVSIAMIFMLISIAGAEPFAYFTTDRSNVTVFDIATKTIATNLF